MSQVATKTTPLVPATVTPMEILQQAVNGGASIETLEKLMGLQERWERNQARKDFDAAVANAKAEMPVIVKNRRVDFTSPKGRTNYRYEDMAEIARTVDPVLSQHGLSYRFRTTSTPTEPVTVTCILSHRSGHSEENTLSAGRDETGNKNGIQAIGSTVTYLQRYALKAALGLAASDDDDARAVSQVASLSDEDAEKMRDTVRALITETKMPIEKFLAWAKTDSISDISSTDLPDIIAELQERKRKLGAKQ